MDPAFLALLRCPIDPRHQATLKREQSELICQNCLVRFPIRQGLPILVIHEAILPGGGRDIEQLPCRRAQPDDSVHH